MFVLQTDTQSINMTLMTATLDLPYLEDKTAGFKIASLPYENAGSKLIRNYLSKGFYGQEAIASYFTSYFFLNRFYINYRSIVFSNFFEILRYSNRSLTGGVVTGERNWSLISTSQL